MVSSVRRAETTVVLVAALLVQISLTGVTASAQTAEPFPLVDELPAQAGLPDPFLGPGGERVVTPEQWPAQREYLKEMLAHYFYGRMPPRPTRDQWVVQRTSRRSVFDEAAAEEEYTVTLSRGGQSAELRIGLIRPNRQQRFPTVIKNCRVLFEREGIPSRYESIVEYDRAAAREAVERGYLLCKFRREDFAADRPNNRERGIFPLYPDYDWGTIAAWAWTQQVVLDVLDELELADMDRVVYTGHSRGGQTAIAAGIYDERADLVVPCTGGYGSVATLRVRDPEGVRGTIDYVAHLKKNTPHWFHPRYYEFVGKQNRLPFDAHTLVSLVAPRPLLNTNAVDDEYNNTLAVETGMRTGKLVYDWLGAGDRCRLHWRPGKHGQRHEDWQALFDFADEVFFDRPGTSRFNEWVREDSLPTLNWTAP